MRKSRGLFAIVCGLLLSFSVNTCGWSLNLFGWGTKQAEMLDLKIRSRVLNFFPIPVEEECLSSDKRRRGICMNTYHCRIQNGKSYGPCALGFGVCCIFTASCDQEVQNNLTYVTSPGFPNLIDRPMNCSVVVRKIDRQVSQLRIDFIHFNIGQPNRRTGICDEDIMEIRNGNRSSLRLCGWNSGQHIYLDVNEADEPVTLDFKLPNGLHSRMWEMRVIQLGFEDRAPAGCLQYFRSPNGTLKTMNYLPNGRFLADQDYLVCVRQEKEMCGISYTPCSKDSFRIGASRSGQIESNATTTVPRRKPNNSTNGSNNVNGNSTDAGQTDFLMEGSGSGPDGQETVTPLTVITRRCRDKVLIPCDFEEFITPGNNGVGICNLEHCGNSLCERDELDTDGNCRVETWATPFRIRVAFGPGEDTGTTLEDNVGMCLMYEQLRCVP
ncbi:uncharacterized protein LOC124952126 [Vespa velutina]|uniref:uncharacterized protein LOC124952126 n=1 Tax=Vespa velutina TaxID=202808 RepID=UPI001FB2CEA2|nr:uncharacterized protein LOC124952126 [Vespa velutina]XP_047357487.1 uncharacterized protein LOC124952126 [Vespa velutina]